jgi:uridylate kinase
MFPDFFDKAMQETQSSSSSGSSGTNRNEIFVVSIGGSLLFQENVPDIEAIQRIASSINNLALEGYKFALVVGGGNPTRTYLEAGRKMNASEFSLDQLGIFLTRANAALFIAALPNAHPDVVTDFSLVLPLIEKGKIPVLGGMQLGFTTDGTAALLAEKMRGTFINLSNVDGVYSSDPAEHKKAKLFRELSYERLFEIVATLEVEAGQHGILDVPAAIILKRSRIPAIFVNGNSLENFESAVKGRPFNGTIVQSSEAETAGTEEAEKEE